MKIIHIVGARPQFIKAAMISRAWNSSDGEYLLHTGQHYSVKMSQLFFDELKLRKPDINLEVGSSNHAKQTSKMLTGIDQYLEDIQPDHVIIYGDTNSTLVGALVGSKLHIPVAHIEAGFRSHDKTMPEEINRICTDHISEMLFCPTNEAVKELANEGITKNVHFVGDITYDATKHFSNKGSKKILEELNLGNYYLCTVHRATNTDNKNNLKNIFDALSELDKKVVLPIHPRTKNKLKEDNLWNSYQNKNIKFIEPTNYLDTLTLIQNADKIITDSGGVLREAYFLKKTCIVLRNNIEFIEAVQNKEIILTGSNKEKIIKAAKEFQAKGEFKEFFGSGKACKKIIEILLK